MAGISTDRVHTQATAILEAVCAALVDPPARRYVTTTIPAIDCEQVVVQIVAFGHNVGNVAVDGWGGPQLPSMTLPSAQYFVWIHRCVPTIDAEGESVITPTDAEEDAAGQQLLGDATNAWNCVVALGEAGAVIPQRTLLMQRWEAQPFEGGMGGGALSFIAGLNEFRALP